MIETDWRTAFINYIKNKVLPPGVKNDDTEVVRIIRRSKNYVLVDKKLYKQGAGSGILMKYVAAEEGKDILQEAHEGTCGNHAASRTLVGQHYQTQNYSSNDVQDASTLPNKITSLLTT